jgi:helix-turn-helix protein
MRLHKREKTFGPGRYIPLDGNAKARIKVFVKGWNARHKQPGQHRGPITRAFMEVLEAMLWGFHNSKTGCCFPSYEAIARKAECCRDTVYQAIRALELAGVLTWVNRITHIRIRELDLFGKWQTRRQVIRTSNSYTFLDPQPGAEGRGRCKSEKPSGTLNQEIQSLALHQLETAPVTLSAGLEAALATLGERIAGTLLREGDVANAPST